MRNSFNSLKKRIQNKKARIAVIGLGYVGLPLAMHLAGAGFEVFGLDTDLDRVARLKKKRSYILDIKNEDLARVMRSGRLRVQQEFEILKSVDVVLVCVPTPLRRKFTPDIRHIEKAIQTLSRYLKKGMLVILESTTYPGTTEELIKPALEKSGLKAGRDFFLSFSPERIDPGNKEFDLTKIPKIVGGLTPESGQLTKFLYEKIISEVILVSSAKVAEMTKLLENSFRIVNIGWINEVTMMCHELGIDVWEVIEAAKTKPFGFMPFYPGLGVGGHCIPDDPLYLFWKARLHGFQSRFIKLASEVNAQMPAYAVLRLQEIFRAQKKNLRKLRLLVIGVTYKKDVKDLRKSPALELITLLQKKGVRVGYFDPFVPYLKIGVLDLISVKLSKGALSHYDGVIVATDHTRVNYSLVRRHAKCIFDIRNVYQGIGDQRIFRL